MTIRRLNAMALLTGLSLVLFVIEMQVPPPLPLPGVKIGLANVVTVYAVFRFRPGEALMILLARIFWRPSLQDRRPRFCTASPAACSVWQGCSA